MIGRNAVNIPIGDDFYCALLFVQQFQDNPDYLEKFNLLFGQWVEHRILYSRLVALVSYWLTGQVNFLVMIWIGNLKLVGIILFFTQCFRRLDLQGYFLLPVLLTMFTPAMYEGNLWAGASTVYMPVCLMGCIAVNLLVKGTRPAFLGATAIAIQATFSFGNGMLLFISGAIVLLILRRSRLTLIWIVTGMITVIVYFTNFRAHSATDAFSVVSHFRHPPYFCYNFLAFVGGIFDYTDNTNCPVDISNVFGIGLGLFEVVTLCYISVLLLMRTLPGWDGDQKRKEAVAWLGINSFLFVTALAIAYSRTSNDVLTTLSSRYKIYSMLFLVMIYWGVLLYFGRKRIVGFAFSCLCFSLLIFNFYVYYGKMVAFKSSYLAGLYNYHRNHKWLSIAIHPILNDRPKL